MLNSLKKFFQDSLDSVQTDNGNDDLALQRAVAALCIEMSRADSQILDQERVGIVAALRDCFELDRDEIDQLLDLAEQDADEATSLFEFTTLLNHNFDQPQKVRFVEHLWRVAYADGQLEKNEAHLVKKVADLLHLRHREYIGAKLRAEAQQHLNSANA